MKLIQKIKSWFIPKIVTKETPLKTLGELDYLDDVWIQDKDKRIYTGWIFDITKKHIIVFIPNENIDFRFSVTKPFTQTQLKQGNKILFFNKPCIQEK